MKIITKNLEKVFTIQGEKLVDVSVKNLITGRTLSYKNEFTIYYKQNKRFSKEEMLKSSEMIVSEGKNYLEFNCIKNGIEFDVRVDIKTTAFVILSTIHFSANDKSILIDKIVFADANAEPTAKQWSRSVNCKKVYVHPHIAGLGQPVYYDSFFIGIESPVGDNYIADKKIRIVYHYGRKLSDFGDSLVSKSFIIGASIGDKMNEYKSSFYKYLFSIARPSKFRLQFNSWYDNMLDIDNNNLSKSFIEIQEKFNKAGLRDLDCYVVDDGWVDYNKKEFWGFKSDKFPNGFNEISELTKKINSTFGVWFGPRGGYSQANQYAKILKGLGYGYCKQSRDICTGDPKYIEDLGNRMMDFITKYNVTYFKLDGFAIADCKNKKHNHPVGGEDGVYFYTFLWEKWVEVFEKMRTINPDIFLNITSYAHLSPWFLMTCDAIWLNNAGDMAYEGKGDNLNQCLNYRDGRYQDFVLEREYQFPLAYVYNHEPCYAERNYNPPLPNKSHKTVVYTDKEFEQYLFGCMMRGTGFIELYYSPSMLDDTKCKINANVLKWAEKNFNIINKGDYFGGVPKSNEIYGYISYYEGKGFISIRNPNDKEQKYTLNVKDYSHSDKEFECKVIYKNLDSQAMAEKEGEKINFTLKPFEMLIIEYLDI